jgi:hypothetical protein
MYPDFIADLGAIGLTGDDIAPIFNAAEAYVRMWEKANDSEARKSAAAPSVKTGMPTT